MARLTKGGNGPWSRRCRLPCKSRAARHPAAYPRHRPRGQRQVTSATSNPTRDRRRAGMRPAGRAARVRWKAGCWGWTSRRAARLRHAVYFSSRLTSFGSMVATPLQRLSGAAHERPRTPSYRERPCGTRTRGVWTPATTWMACHCVVQWRHTSTCVMVPPAGRSRNLLRSLSPSS